MIIKFIVFHWSGVRGPWPWSGDQRRRPSLPTPLELHMENTHNLLHSAIILIIMAFFIIIIIITATWTCQSNISLRLSMLGFCPDVMTKWSCEGTKARETILLQSLIPFSFLQIAIVFCFSNEFEWAPNDGMRPKWKEWNPEWPWNLEW